jgi:hypothetical protein
LKEALKGTLSLTEFPSLNSDENDTPKTTNSSSGIVFYIQLVLIEFDSNITHLFIFSLSFDLKYKIENNTNIVNQKSKRKKNQKTKWEQNFNQNVTPLNPNASSVHNSTHLTINIRFQ